MIFPDDAEPPIRIDPVVIEAPPILIVVVVPPATANALPAANVIVILPPLVEPTFNTWAAAPVPMLVVSFVPVAPEPAIFRVFVVFVFAPLNKSNSCKVEAAVVENIEILCVPPEVIPFIKEKVFVPVLGIPSRICTLSV